LVVQIILNALSLPDKREFAGIAAC